MYIFLHFFTLINNLKGPDICPKPLNHRHGQDKTKQRRHVTDGAMIKAHIGIFSVYRCQGQYIEWGMRLSQTEKN
jgi:hypothetical protein